MNKIKAFLQKETSKNVTFVAFGKVITVFFGFLTIFLSAKGLGVKGFGALAFFYVCVECLGVFSLPGVNQVLNKAIHNNRSGFYVKAYKLSFLSSLIPLIILVMFFIVTYLASIDVPVSTQTFRVSFLGALFIIFQSLEKHSAALPALKKFKELAFFNILSSFLKFLTIGCISYYYQDLFISLIAFCVGQLVLGLVSFIYCYSLLGSLHEDSSRSYISESIKISLIAVFNVLSSRIDRVILYSLSPVSLGWLQAGISYPEKIREVINTLASVVINSWLSLGEVEFLKRVFKYRKLIILLLSTGALVLAVSSYFYIPLLFGPEYHGALVVAILMGPIVSLKLLNSSFANYVIVYGDVSRYQKLMFFYQGLYLVFVLSLIWPYGYVGAASAMLASELVLAILYICLFRKD